MNQKHSPVLSLDVSRYFNIAPERLFNAWLQPSWCKWLPPKGASCKILSMCPEVSGTFRLEMTMPDGRTVQISGRYLEITKPTKIVLTWTGSYDEKESIITVTFDGDGDGTLMRLHQQGFSNASLRDGYQAGWTTTGGTFDKLSDFLSRSA